MKNNHETWTALANALANTGWTVNGRVPLAGDVPHIVWFLGPLILAQKSEVRHTVIEEAAEVCDDRVKEYKRAIPNAGPFNASDLSKFMWEAAECARLIRALGDGEKGEA